jgi:HPt (histidine-containing phosphotransfer) domain-containing protein/predicted  nucleic acid-binding Zn-ribbon protein
MSDRPRDPKGVDGAALRAMGELRSALEGIERELDRATSGETDLRRRFEKVLEALRADAFIVSFDGDGEIDAVEAAFAERFGIDPTDGDAALARLLDEASREQLRQANARLLEGEAECVVSRVTFGEAPFEVVQVARVGDAGERRGVEAICRPLGVGRDEGVAAEGEIAFGALMARNAQRLLDAPGGGATRKALASFGEQLAVDRVVLNDYDEAARTFYVQESWQADGVEPAAQESRGISISELPWAYSTLSAGETVQISGAAELPREAASEKRLYASGDVKAALLVPLSRGGTLTGFVSLQSAGRERSWTDTDVARARQLAAILSASRTVTGLTADLETARRESEGSAEQLEATKREVDEARILETDLRGQVDELSLAAETARGQVGELEAELDRMRSQLGELESAAEEARKTRDEAEAVAAEAREQGNKTEAERDHARRQLEAVNKELESARPQLEDANKELDSARRQLEEAKEELDSARRQLEEVGEERDSARRQLEEAKEEVDNARRRAEEAAEDAGRRPGGGYDPDATIDIGSPHFDPEPEEAADETEEGAEEAEEGAEEAEESDRGLPRAVGLEEILERTQAAKREKAAGAKGFRSDSSGAEQELGTEQEAEAEEADVEEADATEADATEADDIALPGFLDNSGAAVETSDDDFGGPAPLRGRESITGLDDDDESAGWSVDPDLEAARRAARQVAGKQGAGPEVPRRPAVLPGLDTKAGLDEVGGNVELYKSLLRKFRHDYKGASNKISGAVEKGNVEVAHLLLHAIRSSAGVIGAVRVRDAAEGLEGSLVRRQPDGSERLTELTASLAELLDTIERLEDGAELVVRPAAADVHLSDPKVLSSYLEGLRQHLRDRKPKQCQLVMREVTARSWPAGLDDDVDRLAELIRAEDFAAADDVYATLLEKLTAGDAAAK